MHRSFAALVDRMLLSAQFGRPRGVASWAVRCVNLLGNRRTLELTAQAADAVASEAAHCGITSGRLLVAIEAAAACVAVIASSFDTGLFRGGFAESDAAYALLAALRERDPQRETGLSEEGILLRRLCAQLDLDAETTASVEACAALRDIGTLVVRETNDARTIWAHTIAGERILLAVPKLARYACAVRAHHENWDGTGYPDGLAGNRIPFEARVVALLDAMHALSAPKPGPRQPALTLICETLKRGAGRRWDPDIARATLQVLFETCETHVRVAL